MSDLRSTDPKGQSSMTLDEEIKILDGMIEEREVIIFAVHTGKALTEAQAKTLATIIGERTEFDF